MKKSEVKFRDLKVGDYIYATTNIDVFKLKINIIEKKPDGNVFHFENDDEYFRLNSGAQNYTDCVKYLGVIAYNLDGFGLECGDYYYWADRNKCLDYLNLCVENAKKNVEKIEKSCGYKWEIDTDSWFFIDLTGVPYFSEKVFESKITCYDNKVKVASKLISCIRIEDRPYLKVDFKGDAILIKFDNGKDYAEYSFTMYEC